MAMPMSACFSEGASLTPSPVIATVCPRDCSARTMHSLCSGLLRANTSVRSASAGRSASSTWSSACPVSARGVSASTAQSNPASDPDCGDIDAVTPANADRAMTSSTVDGGGREPTVPIRSGQDRTIALSARYRIDLGQLTTGGSTRGWNRHADEFPQHPVLLATTQEPPGP